MADATPSDMIVSLPVPGPFVVSSMPSSSISRAMGTTSSSLQQRQHGW